MQQINSYRLVSVRCVGLIYNNIVLSRDASEDRLYPFYRVVTLNGISVKAIERVNDTSATILLLYKLYLYVVGAIDLGNNSMLNQVRQLYLYKVYFFTYVQRRLNRPRQLRASRYVIYYQVRYFYILNTSYKSISLGIEQRINAAFLLRSINKAAKHALIILEKLLSLLY